MIYNFGFTIWNKIYDRHSIKFLIGEGSRLTKKGNNWYIYDFLKTVGNNTRASFPLNAAAIACFLYFNNNIFSVITTLAFDKDNITLIQIFRLHTCVLFVCKLSFLRRSQKCILISKCLLKINYLLKAIKTHGSAMVCSMKCLYLKNRRVSFFPELSYTTFQRPHDIKKR